MRAGHRLWVRFGLLEAHMHERVLPCRLRLRDMQCGQRVWSGPGVLFVRMHHGRAVRHHTCRPWHAMRRGRHAPHLRRWYLHVASTDGHTRGHRVGLAMAGPTHLAPRLRARAPIPPKHRWPACSAGASQDLEYIGHQQWFGWLQTTTFDIGGMSPDRPRTMSFGRRQTPNSDLIMT